MVIYKSCRAALWSRSFCNMTIVTSNFWETKISNQIQREEIDSFTYYLRRNGITYAIARKFFLGNIWSDDSWKWIWSTSVALSSDCRSNYFAAEFSSFIFSEEKLISDSLQTLTIMFQLTSLGEVMIVIFAFSHWENYMLCGNAKLHLKSFSRIEANYDFGSGLPDIY